MEELIGSGFRILLHRPGSDVPKRFDCGRVEWEEEIGMLLCSFAELVTPLDDLGLDFLNTRQRAFMVMQVEPLPESRCQVEGIVAVLRFDEDIAVDDVHQAISKRSAKLRMMSGLRVPMRRNASPYVVLPSRVAEINVDVKRSPIRRMAVR